MWHDQGNNAGVLPATFPVQPGRPYEAPETKRRLKNLLDACGMSDQLVNIPAQEATIQELLRTHSAEYLDRLQHLNEVGGPAGMDAPVTPGSYDIARLAAGGCIAAVDAILDGRIANAYALVRPPGHHAEADTGKGFCLLNNGAIAAKHALEAGDVERVAIVDWDVHHGNGVQKIFWDDPAVLTISIHQELTFPPDSGGLDETGADSARGTNINIPLPPGSGWGAYEAAFQRVVIPAVRAFQPGLIIVASGYDAGFHDPLGRMLLHSGAFRHMTEMILEIANVCCDGRILVTHEGGYSEANVPFDALAVFEALSGIDSGVKDPFLDIFQPYPWQALQGHQEQVIAAAEKTLKLLAELPASGRTR